MGRNKIPCVGIVGTLMAEEEDLGPEEAFIERLEGKKAERPRGVHALSVRRAEALVLRSKGYSFQQIADRLGICITTAWKDVGDENARLAEAIGKNRDALIAGQIAALDNVIYEALEDDCGGDKSPGSSRAANRKVVVDALSQKNKLLGLESATKIDISQKIHVTEERKVLIAQITGQLGPTAILDVFGPVDDQDQGGFGHTLQGESPAKALPPGETEGA